MSISLISRPRGDVLFSGDPMPFEIQTGGHGGKKVQVRCHVILSAGGKEVHRFTVRRSPSDGTAHFDPQLIVDSYLRSLGPNFDHGTLLKNNRVKSDGYVSMYCSFRNIDAVTGSPISTIYTDWRYHVVRGRTSPGMELYLEQLNTVGALLNTVPSPHFITKDMSAYLSYLVKADSLRLAVMAQFLFSGGTGKTVFLLRAGFDKGVYHFSWTYPQLETAAGSSFETVRFWMINLSEDPVSDVVTYNVFSETPEHARTLVFENSLGGLDTVCLLGKAAEKNSYSWTVNGREGNMRNTHLERTKDFEIASGHFIRRTEDRKALQQWFTNEVMAAENVYLYTEDYLFEVRMSHEEAEAFRDKDHLASTDLKLTTVKVLKAFRQKEIELPGPIQRYHEKGRIQEGYYEIDSPPLKTAAAAQPTTGKRPAAVSDKLVYRIPKGTELTWAEGDNNLRLLSERIAGLEGFTEITSPKATEQISLGMAWRAHLELVWREKGTVYGATVTVLGDGTTAEAGAGLDSFDSSTDIPALVQNIIAGYRNGSLRLVLDTAAVDRLKYKTVLAI